jgi:hypothetical protein
VTAWLDPCGKAVTSGATVEQRAGHVNGRHGPIIAFLRNDRPGIAENSNEGMAKP